MASIFKRGRIYWVKYSQHGKIHRDTLKTKNKKFAKAMMAIIELDLLQERLPFPLVNKTKLSDLCKLIIRDYERRERSKRSIQELTHKVDVIESFFNGNAPPTVVTSDRIDDFIDEMIMNEASNATVNRYLAVLRRMFILGSRRDPPIVLRMPHIEMLPENNTKTRFIELEQYLKLRDTIEPYLKLFVIAAYYYGLRVSELKGLRWDHVDCSRQIWYLRLPPEITKNNEPKVLPLNDELKEGLKKLWEYRKMNDIDIPYVYLNKKETGPIKNFRRVWNRACRELKIGYGYKMGEAYNKEWEQKLPPGPTLHDFRRSAARNMRLSGATKEQSMKVTGHKTSAVFDNYNIVIDRDLEKAVQQRYEFEKKEMKKLEENNAKKNQK